MVYEVGIATIGWPPTIDITGGRQIIQTKEFELIRETLEKKDGTQ